MSGLFGDPEDYSAKDITYTYYEGLPCPHCGAYFPMDPISGVHDVECPQCHSWLQVAVRITTLPQQVKDWLRCAQCQRHLPSDSPRPVDPVGALLNELGLPVLCEECDWMRKRAEKR